jgi:hypothetical protein
MNLHILKTILILWCAICAIGSTLGAIFALIDHLHDGEL